MQAPQSQNSNHFNGIHNEPLPPTPTSRQMTGALLAPDSPLRYITTSLASPHQSPGGAANGQQPSMFQMPSPTTNNKSNNHTQQQQHEQIVGPSDHYGVHHQSMNSLSSPSYLNGGRQNYSKIINSNEANQINPTATVRAEISSAKPSQPKASLETKVCVIVDSRTPVIIKVPVSPARIKLADLKMALPAINQPNYKYFFKSNDSEFGIVKEEIQEDESHLPTYRNRVVAWIVTPGKGDDELASRFRSETSDTCNITYSNTSYDDGSSSILTTDLESTSYFTDTDEDSNSCSNYSRTTCDTFISQRRNNRHRADGRSTNQGATRTSPYRYNGGHHHNGNHEEISSSSTSSSSTTTQSSNAYSDATAVQCVTVHLVLTNENFLGLHIYANAVNGVDEGIYVDDVTENSAVALDGRIEPGDKLIQVNDRNLEELTNDEAVKVLKEAVIRRGPLKLVVAKFMDSNKNDPIAGLKEAIHPINTAAWVAHAQAMTMPSNQTQKQSNSATSSPSFGSNAQDTDCIRPASGSAGRLAGFNLGLRLSKDKNDLKDIVMHMKMPTIGLDIRDRQWLKITIPGAFLGSDLVKWLERNVQGFGNEYDARKFAIRMLEEGIIQDPLSSNHFSPKSFYTFVI